MKHLILLYLFLDHLNYKYRLKDHPHLVFENLRIFYGEHSVPCEIKPGARDSFLSGRYDPLDELLQGTDEVSKTADSLSYIKA